MSAQSAAPQDHTTARTCLTALGTSERDELAEVLTRARVEAAFRFLSGEEPATSDAIVAAQAAAVRRWLAEQRDQSCLIVEGCHITPREGDPPLFEGSVDGRVRVILRGYRITPIEERELACIAEGE